MTKPTMLDFLNKTSSSEKELLQNTLKSLNTPQKGQTAEKRVATLASIMLEKSTDGARYLFIALVNCMNANGDYSTDITATSIYNLLNENTTEQLLSFLIKVAENKSLSPYVLEHIKFVQEKPISEVKGYHQILLEKIKSYR